MYEKCRTILGIQRFTSYAIGGKGGMDYDKNIVMSVCVSVSRHHVSGSMDMYFK